jgi:hypothetical protein
MSTQVVRAAGALSLAALAVIVLGCMSLSFGGRNYTTHLVEDDGLLCQEGKVKLGCSEERAVYYPIPYASPPNLDVSAGIVEVAVLDQKPDHFRVRWAPGISSGPPPLVCWKAKGLRRVAVPCAAPVTIPETVPPPKLPELPAPVEQPKP